MGKAGWMSAGLEVALTGKLGVRAETIKATANVMRCQVDNLRIFLSDEESPTCIAGNWVLILNRVICVLQALWLRKEAGAVSAASASTFLRSTTPVIPLAML